MPFPVFPTWPSWRYLYGARACPTFAEMAATQAATPASHRQACAGALLDDAELLGFSHRIAMATLQAIKFEAADSDAYIARLRALRGDAGFCAALDEPLPAWPPARVAEE